ncbi:response regulator [Thermodesulfobacteriota bacterium]
MTQKILLVDDEKGVRKVLSISLTDSGYQVIEAKNGEEAISLFRESHPPIVLTDIKMPGIDGIQVLKTIKKESPDTEVIMLTGHGDMELAIQSLKHEATDFITKPISTYALEIALKRANERLYYKAKIKEYTEDLESLVEEKTKKLVEAERLATVGQTVAGLAHAIKNIAGGLSGGAFVLEKGIELDNKKYLSQGWEMIRRNIDRIKDMVLDLLNFAKEREPDYHICDPNTPLREVYELMLPRADEYGVMLEIDVDEDLQQVNLDPDEIHRCILNLVTNAIDACSEVELPHDKGRVVMKSKKNKDYAVEYRIIDNGCGMDEETRAKIFQRFFSTKGSRGTGLGLMIAKKVIDEHDGVIILHSEEKKGTRFIIRLPEKDLHPGMKAS